ncbi:MAG: hypothetical protein V7L25_29850 [Nostoc sp.]
MVRSLEWENNRCNDSFLQEAKKWLAASTAQELPTEQQKSRESSR